MFVWVGDSCDLGMVYGGLDGEGEEDDCDGQIYLVYHVSCQGAASFVKRKHNVAFLTIHAVASLTLILNPASSS